MKWDYSRKTVNIYRLPHHFGPKLQSEIAYEHKARMRNAIDFKLDVGTTIVAALDGIVEQVADEFEDNGRLERTFLGKSNYIIIEHHNNEFSLYVHLKKDSTKVKEGQLVRMNQQIGKVGLSCFTSYPHLHFEVWTPRLTRNQHRDPTLLVRFKHRGKIFTVRSPTE